MKTSVKNFMEYKDYTGSVRYSDEDEVFYGKVMFIPDLVNYEGTDVKSLKKSFHEAVDDYLETCSQLGKKPARPCKGSFNVRMPEELHRRAVVYAEAHAKKLNAVVSEAVEKFLETAEG